MQTIRFFHITRVVGASRRAGHRRSRRFPAGALAALVAALFAVPITAPAQEPARRKINVHVIGFGVDERTTKQLTEMAAAGGGRYFPAANEAQLTAALGSALGVPLTQTAGSEQEANNTLGAATAIAASGAVSGTIDPRGDSDWYAIELDQQGRLNVRLVSPAGLDLVFRVLNGDGTDISGWQAPLAAGGEAVGAVSIPARGPYFVELGDSKHDAAAPDAYTLELRFEPGDALEPNGAAGRAAAFAPGEDVYGSILPVGDQDWFTFEVPRQGAATIRFSQVPAEIDLHFRVHNAERADLSGWIAPLKAGADNQAVVDLPAAGRYYIEAGDGRNDAAAPGVYRLDLHFDAGDLHEPNGSPGTATRIQPDSQSLASILPRGDQDWYAISVDHPGALEVALTGVPPEIDLHFRVHNPDWTDISGWVAPLRAGSDNVAAVDLPVTGTYYLNVTDGKNDARAAAPYALQTRYQRSDPTEPGGTRASAAHISVGQDVQGSILPKGDQDCYAFEVAQPGTIQVAVTNVPPELDIGFRVLNAEGVDISGWKAPLRAGAETVEKVDLPAAGKYYVALTDLKNDARSAAMYTLRITSPAP
jgi:hypothetical protein